MIGTCMITNQVQSATLTQLANFTQAAKDCGYGAATITILHEVHGGRRSALDPDSRVLENSDVGTGEELNSVPSSELRCQHQGRDVKRAERNGESLPGQVGFDKMNKYGTVSSKRQKMVLWRHSSSSPCSVLRIPNPLALWIHFSC
jgi:hypothetical protein